MRKALSATRLGPSLLAVAVGALMLAFASSAAAATFSTTGTVSLNGTVTVKINGIPGGATCTLGYTASILSSTGPLVSNPPTYGTQKSTCSGSVGKVLEMAIDGPVPYAVAGGWRFESDQSEGFEKVSPFGNYWTGLWDVAWINGNLNTPSKLRFADTVISEAGNGAPISLTGDLSVSKVGGGQVTVVP